MAAKGGSGRGGRRAVASGPPGDDGLADLLRGAPIGIIVTRIRDGMVVHANPVVLDMFGFDEREMVGRTTVDLRIFENEEARQRMLRELLMSGPDRSTSRPFRRKDGTRGLAVVTGTRLVHAGEDHAAWFFIDVTEKLAREAELRESEHLHRSVFAALAEGVVLVTREGTIAAVNESAARMFGLSSAEILGPMHRNAWRAVHEDGSELREEEQPFAVTLRTGEPVSGVVMGVTLEGKSVRWIEVNSQPLQAAGEQLPHAVVVSFTDVTQRKKSEEERRILEQQLLQSQKMEAIGTLAGGIAHDFNNILFAIQGNAEMTRLELPAGHAARASLDEMLRACDRAKALVRRILAFSSRHETRRRPVRLGAVVAETVKLMRTMPPPGVQLVSRPEGEDLPVLADEVEIQQVVMNLVTNAMHAMREHPGEVVVTHGAVDVDERHVVALPGLEPGRHARIVVSDEGHGMDADVVGRIFDPFFTTRGPGEGSGLGLAVVRQIVASHDGAISVRSAPGRGSTFEVYLPITDRVASRSSPSDLREVAKGRRILFVDDDPELVKLAEKLLERAGFQAMAVGSAAKALALLDVDPGFDFVLSDVHMPGMGGLRLAEEIGRRHPGLPVVLTTGRDAPVDAEEAKALGVREVLAKPWTTAQVLELVKRLFG